HQAVATRKICDGVLRAAPEPVERGARHAPRKSGRGGFPQDVALVDVRRNDSGTAQGFFEIARDGLDFGKFRHFSNYQLSFDFRSASRQPMSDRNCLPANLTLSAAARLAAWAASNVAATPV